MRNQVEMLERSGKSPLGSGTGAETHPVGKKQRQRPESRNKYVVLREGRQAGGAGGVGERVVQDEIREEYRAFLSNLGLVPL